MSLTFESVVPGRWVFSFLYCGQVVFFCCSDGQRQYVNTSYFRKKRYFCDLALPHYIAVFYVHISLFLRRTSPAIAASRTQKTKPTTLEYLPSLYAREHAESWAISSTFTTPKMAVKMPKLASRLLAAYNIIKNENTLQL